MPNRYIGQRFIAEVEAYADEHELYLYQGLKQMPITVPYLKGYVRDFISLLDPLKVEVLEPTELRQKFEEISKNMNEIYN